MYNTNNQIKFKTSMLRSRLCDYNDAYILPKETIIVTNTAPNNRDKKVNNSEVDHVKDIDVVMPMYNLIEYSDNYSKTWEVYDNTIETNHLYTMMEILLIFLNGMGGQFDPKMYLLKYVSSKMYLQNVSSKERAKTRFLVTFNIIISHIFLENFIEIPQVVQKILRISLSILAIFINFINFLNFLTFLCFKGTNDVSL